ncbi:MAG: hypothetical protein ABSB86_18310 [Bryobacteraceae bacterium]|jgi:hypothetical protein
MREYRGQPDRCRDQTNRTYEAPNQPPLLGHHDLARTPALTGISDPSRGAARRKEYAQASRAIANTHQTCQCDKSPLATKNVVVQPASAPNRHAESAPTATATGVNKSPNSDQACLYGTWETAPNQWSGA